MPKKFFHYLLGLAAVAKGFQTSVTDNNHTAISSDTIHDDIAQNTYLNLRQHLVDVNPTEFNGAKLTPLQRATELYYTMKALPQDNFAKLQALNTTLTIKFFNKYLKKEGQQKQNRAITNWLLEQKISLIAHYEDQNNIASTISLAKELYKHEPLNEYALIVLITDILQNTADLESAAEYIKELQQLRLQKIQADKTQTFTFKNYLSYLYLGMYEQKLADRGKLPLEQSRLAAVMTVNYYTTALQLARKDIPKISQYYSAVEQAEFMYDYTTVREHKLQQMESTIKDIRMYLFSSLGLLRNYEELPRVLTTILNIDPQFQEMIKQGKAKGMFLFKEEEHKNNHYTL